MTLLETFSSLFWNSQHKGYVRPNMCLQISNSCHTQVTLSSRPFNSLKAQNSFPQIFLFQEQLNRSILNLWTNRFAQIRLVNFSYE